MLRQEDFVEPSELKLQSLRPQATLVIIRKVFPRWYKEVSI